MVDGYECPNGHQFDIEREGHRAAEAAQCPRCAEQAKRKLQFNIGRLTGKMAEPTPDPREQQPTARPSAIHAGGTIGEGNRFYIEADDTVTGLSVAKGSKVVLDALYIEGGNPSIDNAGELEARDAEIN